VVAGVFPQQRECLLHREASALGDHSFGLLDAVERVVELLVENVSFECGAVLKDGDGGHIGERLGVWK
jgi:hypothetical protein